jgi:transposase-like protein
MAQVHILAGPERRRRFSIGQQRAIVAAAFAPGAIVADVARAIGVTEQSDYRWRRKRSARLAEGAALHEHSPRTTKVAQAIGTTRRRFYRSQPARRGEKPLRVD